MDNKYMKRTVIRGAKMNDLYIGSDDIIELIAADIQTVHVMGWVENATLVIDDASVVKNIKGSGKLHKMTLTEMMFDNN